MTLEEPVQQNDGYTSQITGSWGITGDTLPNRVAVSEQVCIWRRGDWKRLPVEEALPCHTSAGEELFTCLEVTVLYSTLWTSHAEGIIC